MVVEGPVVWRGQNRGEVEPLSGHSVVLGLWCGVSIDLHKVDDRDHMIAGVATWLARHGDELWVRALNVALFLELADASNLGVLVVINVAARESQLCMESLLLAPDEEDVCRILSSHTDADGVGGGARDLLSARACT